MCLLTTTKGRTRVLTLNRPDKRNALNDELIAALSAALSEANEDAELRAIVIRGEGKDFCSGADLSSIQKMATATFEDNLEDAGKLAALFTLIRKVKLPVIAAVHGRALAGGCGLATACDLVLATNTARFGYPEVKIGFVPALVMTFLRRNISEKRAFETATRGFEFTATTALEFGLVNHLFDESSFDAEVEKYASAFENVSRSAVAMTKELLYDLDSMNFADSMKAGTIFNATARESEDCKKGIARFLEK